MARKMGGKLTRLGVERRVKGKGRNSRVVNGDYDNRKSWARGLGISMGYIRVEILKLNIEII